MYNYGGYNNITYLGGEVKNPAKNIPRAIVFSVLIVAVLYVLMSVVIIGTIPWRDAAVSHAVVSEFIGKLYGSRAASVMTCLILVATLAGVFTGSLGYSRILYAAGAEGNFFKVFGRVHPTGRFPTVSLLATNAMAIPLCWFSLERLLSALMIIQIVLQFIPQIVAMFAIPSIARKSSVPTACGLSRPGNCRADWMDLCRLYSGTTGEHWHCCHSTGVRTGRVLSARQSRQIMALRAKWRPLVAPRLTCGRPT